MSDDLSSRILACLEEKPRSISEIARELDAEKYEVSKKIEVLDDKGYINTHRIGRSTACILSDVDATDDTAGTGADVSGEQDDVSDDVGDAAEAPADAEQDDAGTDEPGAEKTGQESVERVDAGDQAAASGDAIGPVEQAQPGAAPTGNTGQAPQQLQAQRGAAEQGAVQQGAAQSGAAQAFQQGDGPRTIGIVSGKGGVGKTVVTLNLGAALMEFGENVIVMDADAEMPNLGIHLGIHTYPTSLKEVVEQDVHIMSAMHVDNNSGLRVIPTSLSAEPASEAVGEAIGMIPDNYTVLVDSPPGYERPVERVIDTCDELVFVTTPELPALADTFKLYQEAQAAGKHTLGVVVNMYQSSKNHLSIAEVEESLEMPVLGVVEHSKLVPRSIMDNQPLVSFKPHAKPSRSFKEIAAELSGYQYEASLLDRVKGFIQ